MTVSSAAALRSSARLTPPANIDVILQVSEATAETGALPLRTWICGEGETPTNSRKDLFMAVAARIAVSSHVSPTTHTSFVLMRNLEFLRSKVTQELKS